MSPPLTGRYKNTALGAETAEHLAGAFEAANDRRPVTLLFDHRTEDLEVEGPLVPGIQHHSQESFHRDVAVADRAPIRHVERAELVVADLHEGDNIHVLAHELLEAAFVP